MANLLGLIQTTFSRGLISHIASRLGESESGISRALAGFVPMVLAGLSNKCESDGSHCIYELSQHASAVAGAGCNNLTGMLGIIGSGAATGSAMEQGEKVLLECWGAATAKIAGRVGEFAGIKGSSAHTLFEMVGVVVPCLLSQYAASNGLKAKGMGRLLASFNSHLGAMLPSELQELSHLLADSPLALDGHIEPARPGPETKAVLGRYWSQVMVGLVGLWVGVFFILAKPPQLPKEAETRRPDVPMIKAPDAELSRLAAPAFAKLWLR